MEKKPTIVPTQLPKFGWICPTCGRVYGPHIPMCYYCPGQVEQFTTTNAPVAANTTITVKENGEVETRRLDPIAPIDIRKGDLVHYGPAGVTKVIRDDEVIWPED